LPGFVLPEDVAWQDIEASLDVVGELRERGRMRESKAIYRLVQAELARQEAQFPLQVTPDLAAALERSAVEIAQGKVVPHRVVEEGPRAVGAYISTRDAGAARSPGPAAVGELPPAGSAGLRSTPTGNA
jgi:hypothetical protein